MIGPFGWADLNVVERKTGLNAARYSPCKASSGSIFDARRAGR